jgi:hypothetical protein
MRGGQTQRFHLSRLRACNAQEGDLVNLPSTELRTICAPTERTPEKADATSPKISSRDSLAAVLLLVKMLAASGGGVSGSSAAAPPLMLSSSATRIRREPLRSCAFLGPVTRGIMPPPSTTSARLPPIDSHRGPTAQPPPREEAALRLKALPGRKEEESGTWKEASQWGCSHAGFLRGPGA